MAKSIKKNYFYNIVYEVLVILIPLITSPYLSRTLGAEKIGVYTYTYTIVSYFVLFARLGIVNHGSREIAKCQSKEERSKVFVNILTLQWIVTAIVTMAYVLYIVAFEVEYELFALIQTTYLLSAALDINWAFWGIEEFKLTVTRNVVIKILNTVLIFFLIKTSDDLLKYVLILSVCNLLGQIAIWPNVKRFFVWVKPDVKEVVSNLKPILILFIPAVAVSLYKMMDKIMLGAMCPKAEVGYYEYATMFVNLPLGLITSLGTVMMPRISKLVSSGESKKGLEYTSISMMFIVALSSAMAFGLAGIAQTFIPWYLGEDFRESSNLLMGLASTILFLSWANVIRTQFLIPYKKDKEYIISLLSGAAINVLINYNLIPHYGAWGAVLGTIAAEFTVAFLQTVLSFRELPIGQYMKQDIGFLFIGGIMFVVVKSLSRVGVQGFALLILQIAIGGTIYILLSFLYLILWIHFPVEKYFLHLHKTIKK